MMESINDMTVKEALERLSLPSFYDDDKRITAYFVIMELGNSIQKIMAEKAVSQYPLEEFFAMRAQTA
jgi:hypothetical protein